MALPVLGRKATGEQGLFTVRGEARVEQTLHTPLLQLSVVEGDPAEETGWRLLECVEIGCIESPHGVRILHRGAAQSTNNLANHMKAADHVTCELKQSPRTYFEEKEYLPLTPTRITLEKSIATAPHATLHVLAGAGYINTKKEELNKANSTGNAPDPT